ncbi:hypothetical protein Ptr902_11690 [Pyrenophora tritici-repentis]|nr:hypothetical protein Ptr902_13535 [Pyrenophora tritici-repentis]KAI2476706.1 hypothetical protein Ptr902_11690 [Pyrenophora tritici-repentis]
MRFVQLVVSVCLTGIAMGRNGCRRCDCHVTLKSSNTYDEATARDIMHDWVRPKMGGGDFEQFEVGPMPGAQCSPGPDKSCYRWQAWFKGWRLCANGAQFNCISGSLHNDPIYTLDCNACTSVECKGDCTLDCDSGR